MVRLGRWVVAALVASGLAGCAAKGPLKAYDGPDRAAGELAVLVAPEHVEVMSIDGREPPPGLLRSRTELALLPGEHVLSVRYVRLFQINSDEHDVVRSRQAALRFQAVAGRRYRLDAPPQANREAAREFAKAPQFRLLDEQAATVAESTAVKSFAEASLIDTISKAFESQGEVSRPVTNLDLLKDIWGRASAEERDAFRHWVDAPTGSPAP